MTEQQKTIAQLMEEHAITGKVRLFSRAPSRPLTKEMIMWIGTFHAHGETLKIPHATSDITPPTPQKVLWTILLEVEQLDRGFDEWANENGFDPESSTAKRAHKKILAYEEQLKSFLGEPYTDFLSAIL